MATSASREPMSTALRRSTSPERICFTNCRGRKGGGVAVGAVGFQLEWGWDESGCQQGWVGLCSAQQ